MPFLLYQQHTLELDTPIPSNKNPAKLLPPFEKKLDTPKAITKDAESVVQSPNIRMISPSSKRKHHLYIWKCLN